MCFDGCYVGKFPSIRFFFCYPGVTQFAMRVKAWNYKLQIALQNLKLTVYQQHEISIES